MKIHSKTDIAYAAGFMDGEGCFYMGYNLSGNGLRVYRTAIQISQCNEEILLSLQTQFGGTVSVRGRGSAKGSPAWIWILTDRPAFRFTRMIYPYLRLKKHQADLFLDLLKRKRERSGRMGIYINPKEHEERQRIISAMRLANRRGIR